MRILIVGLGIQGNKRAVYAKKDLVASVDPYVSTADYKNIFDVPLDLYDSAMLCVPDKKKEELIEYCINNNKNVLVEKPLFLSGEEKFKEFENEANRMKCVIYTAYNHRFEPHFINIKNFLNSKKLGKIYRCKLYYGNGTAKLVRTSKWRDQGSGVIHDLASHLIDTLYFWFGNFSSNFELNYANNYENRAPDNAIISTRINSTYIDFEISMLSWRNTFKCDIIGEKGSIHINSLCKWGPSEFLFRKRKFPSGKPKETKKIIVKKDPTWLKEYKHFKNLCTKKIKTNLSKDLKIERILKKIELEL
tara:strand:+ start:431 stop:1345 length:915 start_codon:yes stop_codon:yes gene_type:complete